MTGESHEVYSDSDDGGNLSGMRNIAKGIIEQSENLIEMQGGERLPTDLITINISHRNNHVSYQSSTGQPDQIVLDIVKDTDLEGGSNAMQAALMSTNALTVGELSEALNIASLYDNYQNNPIVFYTDQGALLDAPDSQDALAQARNNNGELPEHISAGRLQDYLELYPSQHYQNALDQAQTLGMDQDYWTLNNTRINHEFNQSGFETNTLKQHCFNLRNGEKEINEIKMAA